jgi:hypothetical protein
LVLAIGGCSIKSRQPSSSQQDAKLSAILDELLADSTYAGLITQAERDLPTDVWKEKPFRNNDSRERREMEVAAKVLDGVKPRLKKMDATALVKSLKVFPYLGSLTNNISGVAYYVYRDGNQMIINELKSRPKSELQGLNQLADDQVEVFEGAQGPGDTLAELIKHRILDQ